MSFNSEFDNCYFISNNDGLYYNGSTSSDVDIDDTYFALNYNDGIRTSGGFNCNLNCSYVIDNSRYGVFATNGTKINPFKCDMSNNLKTIYLNYGTVSLNAKYNQLQALNNGFAVSGYSPARATCGTNTSQICNNNRWESDPGVAPSYNFNFKLWVYGCPTVPQPTIISLTDNDRQYQTCGSKMSSDDLLSIESHNISTFSEINLSIDNESYEMDDFQSEPINYSAKILEEIVSYGQQLNALETVSGTITSGKYNYIQELIAEYFVNIEFDENDETFREIANDIIDFNNALAARKNITELDYYTLHLDIALLNRLQGKYDLSIDQLNTLSLFTEQSIVLSDSEYDYIQKWLCILQAEKSAKEGLLTIDEFILALEDCEFCMKIKSNELNEESSETELIEKEGYTNIAIPKNTFLISPNPNNGSFTIFIDSPCTNCEIQIINSLGQTVRQITPSQFGLQEINVEGINTGHYKVMYFIDGKIVDTETIIVK